MDPRLYFDALVSLLRKLGVSIREDRFDADLFGTLGRRGGLCTLAGSPVLVLDSTLPLEDRCHLMLEALLAFDTEPLAMPPYVRERLASLRAEHRRRRAHMLERQARPKLRLVPKP